MKLSNLFFSLSRISRKVALRLSRNDEWRAMLQKWKKDKGEHVLRLDYPHLNSDSLVLDLGGYQGQWASDIYAKYRCKVVVFEPYEKYAEEINQRFGGNPEITVHTLGLSNKDAVLNIAIDEESSSIFKADAAANTAEISLKQAKAFLQAQGYKQIDLMKINIEGGEYDLLDHLIAEGLTQNIHDLQIQFHDFVPDAMTRMKAIQQALSQTHELSYQYPFLWENWKLKQN